MEARLVNLSGFDADKKMILWGFPPLLRMDPHELDFPPDLWGFIQA
ncbi:hypothetical protein [Lacrimispora sp.]